ncbi:MAG: RluA family pseudouridine synthase [Clostridia bacterium]|jgi:23S rRNA pseudouridine1911/1915/1917 synthase|uniref:Pseudouridine synthase n=1 Tax=Maccoyibacter intestinihominis TaxID=3133499 RepID=A0ABV1HE91_9FIRM|nr:RluA family pseudouridine synthase [Lachnospiraceae bacterium]MEE0512764.1 RluA family pseudouridine synthase [Lachnospiraceae bacterium]HBH99601.1 RNA pseudouridine synthase [Lachnospiraceae bacterium]
MEKHCFTADIEHEDQRIDRYLTEMLPEQSRSFFQKLIRDGFVIVNHIIVKVNYRLKTGDVIEIDIPDAVPTEIVPENIPLDILYEDDDLLIVNKPKGMVVHPAVGHSTGTLVNAIMYHCQGNLSGINGEIRPGIVHRIDKDTTGSLIICKNDEAHRNIAEQIKEHSVTRRYVGVVAGTFSEESGTVEGAIGRHPNDRKRMTINEKNGKPAVTHYRVLQTLKGASFMEFELETGRTHQIRVHMASISHPLLGDTVYGNSKNPYKLQGQALHARTIGFIHPTTGEYIEVSAPIPEYMTELVRKLS